MPIPKWGHRKQLVRSDEPGEARFLTFSCFQRRPFLSRDRSRTWVIDGIQRARETHGFDLWAYVIMPEHVHLLIYPGHGPLRVADMLYTLKKSVTSHALAFVRRHSPAFLAQMVDRSPRGAITHRFWQRGGGYDENLFTNAKVWEKIDYMHANPVKRGLCERPEDWNWSSARAFADTSAGPLALDLESLPTRSRR